MTTARLAKTLTAKGLTLATAESCTGGLIAHTLTNIPGSSSFMAGGIIAYANKVKTGLLGVPAPLIEAHGAVSGPVARAMAEGALNALRVDLAIAATGIAGPTGGSKIKPVGLVFLALASRQNTIIQQHLFTGSRTSIKQQACRQALALLAQTISRDF